MHANRGAFVEESFCGVGVMLRVGRVPPALTRVCMHANWRAVSAICARVLCSVSLCFSWVVRPPGCLLAAVGVNGVRPQQNS